MLLGASRYLAETRNFDGTTVVIFQPAEEGGGGGREMCNDGMMDRWGIDEVYGMHNWPGLPVGEFSIRAGTFFAATDLLKVEFEGRGGHAAKPQETVDTLLMAAHAVTALQSIVSRNADPIDPPACLMPRLQDAGPVPRPHEYRLAPLPACLYWFQPSPYKPLITQYFDRNIARNLPFANCVCEIHANFAFFSVQGPGIVR